MFTTNAFVTVLPQFYDKYAQIAKRNELSLMP